MSTTVLAITLMAFCVSAFIMDAIGVHGIFGGFILGVFMPRGLFVTELKKKVEPLAVVLLLPMFFTYSGLNTRMDMVNLVSLLLIALGILAVSIAAKSALLSGGAGLRRGQPHRDGDRRADELARADGTHHHQHRAAKGIIGPTLFSMLVLMAIVTTMMASPLFEYVYGRKARVLGEMETLNGARSDRSDPVWDRAAYRASLAMDLNRSAQRPV